MPSDTLLTTYSLWYWGAGLIGYNARWAYLLASLYQVSLPCWLFCCEWQCKRCVVEGQRTNWQSCGHIHLHSSFFLCQSSVATTTWQCVDYCQTERSFVNQCTGRRCEEKSSAWCTQDQMNWLALASAGVVFLLLSEATAGSACEGYHQTLTWASRWCKFLLQGEPEWRIRHLCWILTHSCPLACD